MTHQVEEYRRAPVVIVPPSDEPDGAAPSADLNLNGSGCWPSGTGGVPNSYIISVLIMACWLMKSEPDECSIDDALAAPEQTVPWTGVRNYQARNFMRDQMVIGDAVLFYHSSCPQPGIVGVAKVASSAYPDPTQFDPLSPYFDAASQRATPRWLLVDVKALRKTRLLGLPALRADPELEGLLILKRGNRLSITPVAPRHETRIKALLAR